MAVAPSIFEIIENYFIVAFSSENWTEKVVIHKKCFTIFLFVFIVRGDKMSLVVDGSLCPVSSFFYAL